MTHEDIHAVAVCTECGEVKGCDEDRCCLACGRDLIVLADQHSADLLTELLGRIAELESRPTVVVANTINSIQM